ncbi:hypothetical protein MPTK1_6g17790 [Marchantia polymorpha subsp. ruderalis]|uniref:Uncharacterized protein n=2 Tax=Marchantia polymorpha TaxID=3197 RepID=A0AAF6BT61_MARPO|nr:hypothetical protein MARPO_0145s0007 [Marchantia polymorpha]BBN15195.1 hypothetical protein Mp_6g17790 [Marchantia polymorpha subsp. ruderalis]|eukprot:PTQ29239.1 hypothetical protein MARPO_0145s0007 [Marchantia polymorpha]
MPITEKRGTILQRNDKELRFFQKFPHPSILSISTFCSSFYRLIFGSSETCNRPQSQFGN